MNEVSGAPPRTLRHAIPAVVLIIGLGFVLLGFPLEVARPEVVGLRVRGGMGVGGPYLALLIALVLYTSSHIAEIVRGSIQAVQKGQAEAAQALALSGTQRMRHVILPQAMRIAVPPIASQYLNLTKNSSLAIAIGYAEITLVSETIFSQGFPALQSFLIAMGLYLILSLTISAFANMANRRLQFVER